MIFKLVFGFYPKNFFPFFNLILNFFKKLLKFSNFSVEFTDMLKSYNFEFELLMLKNLAYKNYLAN